jgi:hypothetical protein
MKTVQSFEDFHGSVNEGKSEVIGVITPRSAEKIEIKKGEGFYTITQASQVSKGKLNVIVIPDEDLEELYKALYKIIN